MEYEIGQKIGYLTITGIGKHHLGISLICKCDCGNEKIISKSRMSIIKSCGCMVNTQHGKAIRNLRVYNIWYHMVKRCTNPKESGYDRYGGKGVTVCKEWENSFESFLSWSLCNGYSKELTIDRIESLKPYEPSNCRWETYYVQEANRGIHKDNTTGHTGIAPLNGKYRAYLTRNKKNKHLGTFATIAEAVSAREHALNQYNQTGTY